MSQLCVWRHLVAKRMMDNFTTLIINLSYWVTGLIVNELMSGRMTKEWTMGGGGGRLGGGGRSG